MITPAKYGVRAWQTGATHAVCKRSKANAGNGLVPSGWGSGVRKAAHAGFGADGTWGKAIAGEGCQGKEAPGTALQEEVSGWGLAEQGSYWRTAKLRLQLSTHLESPLRGWPQGRRLASVLFQLWVLCASGVPVISKSDSYLFICFTSFFPSGRRLLIHLLPFKVSRQTLLRTAFWLTSCLGLLA